MITEGGPSLTAQRVAAHRIGFERIPAGYGDPAADDALAAAVANGIEVRDGRMHDYLGARTAFFDGLVVRAIDRGITQIVIGGAGYDGRALRYAAPGVRWFEVDHPATQRDKLARLRQLGLDAGHVRFVAADFIRDPVGGRLVAAGLDASLPALFLLEGVAVYLEPAVLERLLGEFRDVAAPGSRLAISIPLIGTSRAGSRFRAVVAGMGEPVLSMFEPDEAADLLARAGWHLAAGTGPEDEPAAARRERLRSAGLLTAQAGPRSSPA
jgi:methyltransferase (TIGR00027 family)